MIQVETCLNIIDNSDAISVKCIHLIGGSFRRWSRLGDLIIVVIKKRKRTKNLIKRDIQLGIIVNVRYNSGRLDGSYIRFYDNKLFLVKDDLNLVGTRLRGVVPLEVSKHPLKDTNVRKKIKVLL